MIAPPPLLAAELSPANVLDILAAGAVAIGALLGLLRGLSGELAHLAALAASCVAGWSAAGPWRRMCADWFAQSAVAVGVATLVGVLAVSVLAGWLVRRLVDKGLRLLIPQPANAILGLVAGAGSLFLLESAICYLLHLIPLEFVQEALLSPSRTWGTIARLFGW